MKKLLLISYYFPPCGGAGVQRWLRILKYLPVMGWDITVLTTRNGDYPVIDKSLMAKLPKDIKIIRTKTPIFGNLYQRVTNDKHGLPYGSLNLESNDSFFKRLLYWIRINLIIPDARFIWNKFAYKEAEKLVREEKYDCVITTSPPHSSQLIGLKLKAKYKLKWVTDFRDPWADIYYLKLAKQNKISHMINSYLERKVIAKADLNLIVSDHINNDLPPGNKVTFTNSYDPADFPLDERQASDKFRIKYIGKVTQAQDINSVITGLNNLPQIHDNIELTFVGTYLENPFNTKFNVRIKNYIPHQEAILEMINSDLLILLINDYPHNKGMLTTKLFEYLGSQVPILCIGPKDGDANRIIQDCKAGTCIDYNDPQAVQDALLEYFFNWKKKEELVRTDNKKYSILEQIRKLDEILTNII